MPYEVIIKKQKTGEKITEEIKTLKQLKILLLQYENELIDFQMREIKTKNLQKK